MLACARGTAQICLCHVCVCACVCVCVCARLTTQASAHLREADLVAEISRQRAVIDALTHQLPTNLQPLAALYEAHITQAEGRVEELTRTNMQLAARVADLELDVLEATHAGMCAGP